MTKGLSKRVVQKLLEQKMAPIKACYKQASKKASHFKGRIVFTLVIGPAGRVSTTRMMTGESKNKALEQCIIQTLRNLAFPAPEGGKKVTIHVTFNFM